MDAKVVFKSDADENQFFFDNFTTQRGVLFDF